MNHFYAGTYTNTSGTIAFGNVVRGRGAVQQALVSNPSNFGPLTSRTYNLPTITGPDAAFFSIDPTGWPVTIVGQACFGFDISFAPIAIRSYTATVTTSYIVGGKPFYITFTLTGTCVGFGNLECGFNIDSLKFPPDTIGLPEGFGGNVTVSNYSDVPVTLNTLAFVTGTSFQINAPPALPVTLAPGASTTAFQVQYTATVIGAETDSLIATLAGGNTGTMLLVGTGIQITPVFPLTGSLQQTLFGFSGEVDALDPEDFNTDDPASFVRLNDWGIPNVEKQMMRVRGHYQDYGPAIITITVQCRRVVQPGDPAVVKNITITKDVPIGTTGATDGWLREFIADIEITDELIQVGVSRAANSGPAFIVDYTPCLEPKGEVVEAT